MVEEDDGRAITPPPAENGVGPNNNNNAQQQPEVEGHRAIHRIRLSTALSHNYRQVELAAKQQRCDVIVVAKADGYGHGAIATALHVADSCGASAFAVATLQEGIALRKAFLANPVPGQWWNKQQKLQKAKQLMAAGAQNHKAGGTPRPSIAVAAGPPPPPSTIGGANDIHDDDENDEDEKTCCDTTWEVVSALTEATPDSMINFQPRAPHIRILVLGPPVGYPRCFDDYYHYDIEVTVSGPEVAAALAQWVADEAERKLTLFERAAVEAKLTAWQAPKTRVSDYVVVPRPAVAPVAGSAAAPTPTVDTPPTTVTVPVNNNDSKDEGPDELPIIRKPLPHPSSTLGNVQGQDLAREVKALMLQQQAAVEAKLHENKQQLQQATSAGVTSACNSAAPSDSGSTVSSQNSDAAAKKAATTDAATATTAVSTTAAEPSTLGTAARMLEAAVTRARTLLLNGGDITPPAAAAMSKQPQQQQPAVGRKRRLRWHALVDSGMGRLGFRTEVIDKNDGTGRRDTVEMLQEMIALQQQSDSVPIEFYGMYTHMADAKDLSTFTHSQVTKFVALLKRVREAGIYIPTVSTDNSAALLTTSLTHFDPDEILSSALHGGKNNKQQEDTLGFVRTGGAIYGQRPAFPQLRPISTLLAFVRHVAIIKEGDSVGYDRAFVAPHDIRIATLTIGFADGYPRDLGNGVGKVQIRGKVFPVAGNICMDMLMVDLGPADEQHKDVVGASVVVGDTAVLWGPLDDHDDNDEGMVRLKDIAATLKTTLSALTCGLNKNRVQRQFV